MIGTNISGLGGGNILMLTGIRIVFLGGDARQLEVIRKCVETDAAVSAAGFNQWETPVPGVSQEQLSAELLTGAACCRI
jgi:dipicolinate synthase subunit A